MLSSLRPLNRADVVLSTVDTVGIPLMLLARARAVRPPFVYVAIGLPERLARLRSRRMERLYARALGAAAAIVAYSEHEADVLSAVAPGARRRTCRSSSCRSASTSRRSGRPARRPTSTSSRSGPTRIATSSCCSPVARAMPETSFLVVTTADRARSLAGRPANVSVETDLPFDEMRRRLERARVVALPVRENSYSGATTVLLQAMALAKPVVVTRTAAIATGYGLVDGENVRLVAPGDGGVLRPRARPSCSATRGRRGRSARGPARPSRRALTWERYVGRIEALLASRRARAAS